MPLRPMTEQLVAEYVGLGVWRHETTWQVVEKFALAEPDAPAVADQHERLTYGEFRRRVLGLADHLESLGLVAGDAVGLQSTNGNAIAVCHLACNAAGLLFVPLSAAWRKREVGHLLSVCGARVVIVPGIVEGFDFVGMIDELRVKLPNLVAIGTVGGSAGDFSIDDIPAAERERPPSRARHDPNDPRFVMATSGTTDLPKLSLWTDNDLWYFMSEYASAVEMSGRDVAVGVAPANTGSTGYCFPVLAPLLHGASSVLLEHWEPTAALRLIADESGTIATAIPTQLIKMLQDLILGELDFTDLRVFTNAGAPMPPDVAEQVDRVFGCTVQPLYGATDGGVPAMTRVSDPPHKRYTTVGRLLPHTTVRLVDQDLVDVAPGEAGEILWRQPMKTSFGYLNDPDRTAQAFVGDGFYRSGDLGTIDEDGYLRIVGRVKDVIIRGGQNISPREIEDLAISHPAIAEIAVVGIGDPVYGERACACVVLAPGHTLTLAELNDHLIAQDVAKFKLPELLEVFGGELPKSAGAKISKVELQEAVLARNAGSL